MEQITKEQYEQIKASGNSRDQAKTAYELGLIWEGYYYGYGIKSFQVLEKDNEYYMDYTIYDNCD